MYGQETGDLVRDIEIANYWDCKIKKILWEPANFYQLARKTNNRCTNYQDSIVFILEPCTNISGKTGLLL